MKKRTVKQLEDELKYYKSFIDKCSSSVGDGENYTMCFSSKEGGSLSYDDIQKIDLDKRYSIATKLLDDDGFFKEGDGVGKNIHKATRVLYILGFRELAATVNKISVEYFLSNEYQDKITSITHQIEHKKLSSKGGKGRVSRHKEAALKIAADTWELVPGASMSTLARKIYEHLNEKYRGLPEPSTIEKWLSDSGLNPKFTPKTKDYKIVVKC
jgi:hypothetical protein